MGPGSFQESGDAGQGRIDTELKRFLERFVVFYESFEPVGTDLLIRIDSERRVIDHTRMQ